MRSLDMCYSFEDGANDALVSIQTADTPIASVEPRNRDLKADLSLLMPVADSDMAGVAAVPRWLDVRSHKRWPFQHAKICNKTDRRPGGGRTIYLTVGIVKRVAFERMRKTAASLAAGCTGFQAGGECATGDKFAWVTAVRATATLEPGQEYPVDIDEGDIACVMVRCQDTAGACYHVDGWRPITKRTQVQYMDLGTPWERVPGVYVPEQEVIAVMKDVLIRGGK